MAVACIVVYFVFHIDYYSTVLGYSQIPPTGVDFASFRRVGDAPDMLGGVLQFTYFLYIL
jgi:hypothetical protein